jgi:hypothetical protein
VIHGIGDLVHFLGGSTDRADDESLVAAESFARYQSFFQDQQNVLAYQSQRLQEYLQLTERRAISVYDIVRRSNVFLIAWGSAFLLATLVLTVVAAVWPERVDWSLPAVTGGLSLVQFAGAFISNPTKDLQKNLTNLATFKMILESHSLKTALTRFHLTTPKTLREFRDPDEADEASRQVDVLRQQLEVIEAADRLDDHGLEDLGIEVVKAATKAKKLTSAEDGRRKPQPS